MKIKISYNDTKPVVMYTDAAIKKEYSSNIKFAHNIPELYCYVSSAYYLKKFIRHVK